jgi:hypothetical protein
MGISIAPGTSGGRRYSGFRAAPEVDGDEVTLDWDALALRMRSEAMPMTKRPISEPMPMPRKVRPTEDVGKPYCSWKTKVNVANIR